MPYTLLVPLALLFAWLPPGMQPHSVEKIGMLFAGELVRAVDILDLFMHCAPGLLLLLKWRLGPDA